MTCRYTCGQSLIMCLNAIGPHDKDLKLFDGGTKSI